MGLPHFLVGLSYFSCRIWCTRYGSTLPSLNKRQYGDFRENGLWLRNYISSRGLNAYESSRGRFRQFHHRVWY